MKFCIALCVAVIACALPAEAQVGRLLKEGVEAAGKKVFGGSAKKTSQEATEQFLKKSATSAAREAGLESVEHTATQLGIAVARHSDDAVRAIGMHGAAIAAPLLDGFGDDGAKALMKLSSTNARRMAMLSDEFGTAGRGGDWMRILAQQGDSAAEWIWKNKGTIAVATAATAFLANPEPFLQASEAVATTSVETAGEHLARPLIEGTVNSVIPEVSTAIATSITKPVAAMSEVTVHHPWMPFALGGFLLGGGYLLHRRYLHPWLRLFDRR